MAATIVTTADGFRFIQRGPQTDDHLAMGDHEGDLAATLYGFAEESDEDDLLVVVGAHVGLWAIRLTQYRDVVAYEANPATAATLARNMDLNDKVSRTAHHLTIRNVAVWDKDGLSGHLVDANDKAEGGSSRFELGGPINTVTLDKDLAVARTSRQVGLMVIDVEGAEARVLRGAAEILREDKPTLVIEVHEGHPGTDDDLRKQLDDVLTEAGYEWFSINLTGERYIARHASKMPDYDMSIYDPVNVNDDD